MTHAVRRRKPIVLLRDQKYNLKDIPSEWKHFASLLTGPRTLVYSPKFLSQCAEKLKDIRAHPDKNTTKFYKYSDSKFMCSYL